MPDNRKSNIYCVKRSDGSFVTGTSRILAQGLPYSQGYIRRIADTGLVTRHGDTVVTIEKNVTWTTKPASIYVAENDNEDPIVGPISEISLLTGLSKVTVGKLYRTHKKSQTGWTVRVATKAEKEEYCNDK